MVGAHLSLQKKIEVKFRAQNFEISKFSLGKYVDMASENPNLKKSAHPKNQQMCRLLASGLSYFGHFFLQASPHVRSQPSAANT